MKRLTIFILLISTLLYGQLVVNEIMMDATDEPAGEWFEILNISGSDVNLSGWTYSDSGYSASPVTITDEDVIVPAGGYAIIANSDTGGSFDCEVVVPTTWRALNNTHDGIFLWNPESVQVEYAFYSMTAHSCLEENISLERINSTGSSTEQSNWDCNTAISGSTPCAENSVSGEPDSIDIAITTLTIEPENPMPDVEFTVYLTLYNYGIYTASGFTLTVQYISEGDTSDIDEVPLPDLASSENYDDEFPLTLPEGTYTILASIDDTIGSNNTYSREISVSEPTPVPTMKISEIMFKPDDTSHEWIEIYNADTTSIDIANWTVETASYSGTITTASLFIEPGDYAIIAQFDTTGFSCQFSICDGWPYLHNESSEIYLKDTDENTVDNAVYNVSASWDYGVSIERLNLSIAGDDPLNWAQCTTSTGSTPCAANSVFPAEYDLAISSITTDPSNPMPDINFALYVWIKNVGINDMGETAVCLYDDTDESGTYTPGDSLLGTDTTIAIAASESTAVVFDFVLPEGMHKFVATIDDEQGNNNELYKGIFVGEAGDGQLIITEIMCNPSGDPEPEWFEIYNISQVDVNIAGWTYLDSTYSYEPQIITSDDVIIPAGGFAIISRLEWETAPSCQVVVPPSWRSLNNTYDIICIWNSDEELIDSVFYNEDSYNCYEDVSMERIDANGSSTDSDNWACCMDPSGSTPCEDNSWWGIEFTEATSISISPNPFDPEVENSKVIVDAPANAVVELRIYNLRGRLMRDFETQRETTWDGRDDSGNPASTGPYVLVAKIVRDGKTEYHREAIAIARGAR